MDCSSSSTTITSWKHYEYDGLNLLRVDERYDMAGGAIDPNDPWRKKEVSTHKPGALGNLLGKMVYLYTGANLNTDTPSASYFYAYFYDAVGNLLWTVDNSGYLNYTFSQDAFGNELSVSPFSGTPWSSARTYCANEHQTGKWIDPFTGLYFFHSRWYDSGVGRFVSRYSFSYSSEGPYQISMNLPTCLPDANGQTPIYLEPSSCFGDGPNPPKFDLGNSVLTALCALKCAAAPNPTKCFEDCMNSSGPPPWGGPPVVPGPGKGNTFVPKCVYRNFGFGCPNWRPPIRGRDGGYRCSSDDVPWWDVSPVWTVDPAVTGVGIGVVGIAAIFYYIAQSLCYAPLFAL